MTESYESERAERGEDVKCVALLCFQFGVYFSLFTADHVQDWLPYPVDGQSVERDDHTHIPLTPVERYPPLNLL